MITLPFMIVHKNMNPLRVGASLVIPLNNKIKISLKCLCNLWTFYILFNECLSSLMEIHHPPFGIFNTTIMFRKFYQTVIA